jgi:hypothetical protein
MRALEQRLAAVLSVAMVLLGGVIALSAWVLGKPGIARGALAGAALAAVYLAVLWRYVKAFVAAAKGEQLSVLDRLALRAGMPGRLLIAGSALVAVARNHPWIDLWAAILTFLSYRLVLGAYEIQVLIKARKEPLPPPLDWDPEDRFATREKRDIGRRRSRDQSR